MASKEDQPEDAGSGEADAMGEAQPSDGAGGGDRSAGGTGGLPAPLKRYGPFAVVALVIAGAVAVLGGGNDDGDDDGGAADTESFAYEDMVRSGPMTPIRAELEGSDFDPGPGCDETTGRIMLPTIYAAPCVEAFDGDNGGATARGVTEDSVKVVAYRTDPQVDPVGAGLVSAAGADLDADLASETMAGYTEIFNAVHETYGREVEIEFYTGTGASDDVERARADAIAIAEMEPFAVVGGPLQASLPFADELAERGVISFVTQPLPESFLEERFPMVWGVTTPEQASALASEAVANLAGPGPAEMAGDPALRDEDRVYALVHYDTPDGDHRSASTSLQEGLAERGVDLADDVEFTLEPARLQEKARTIISRLKDAGVTTVIFYGDPLTPSALTAEATAQDYFPEWILGPNLLADTNIFGRTFDQEQWANGFGLAFSTAANADEASTAYEIYEWAFGEEPPSNIYATLEPGLRAVFDGIHLAGPELTVESFRDAQFRRPAAGGGPSRPLTSRGDHGIWEDFDHGSNDDAALIWWDPEAEGVDETGSDGTGMYRFANGGQRYRTGEFPTSLADAGLFDEEASVIEIPPDELDEGDRAPDYPAPDL